MWKLAIHDVMMRHICIAKQRTNLGSHQNGITTHMQGNIGAHSHASFIGHYGY
jgi:hypothetical protein